MAKNRKARRNAVAHAELTGKLPVAAYRELRAESAPYERYVVELYNVADAHTGDGHTADFWGYRVTMPDGTDLNWFDVLDEGDHAGAGQLTPRHRYMLKGGMPLEIEALQVRFPGARIRRFTTMPEICHHHLASCWSLHRDCTVPCENLQRQDHLTAERDAETAYYASHIAREAEHEAMEARHRSDHEALGADQVEVTARREHHSALVAEGRWEELRVADSKALYADEEALRTRWDRLWVRHRAEVDQWHADRPVPPAHWPKAGAL
ncbi:hypothetical protein [Streptomyces sp. NPDC054865]